MATVYITLDNPRALLIGFGASSLRLLLPRAPVAPHCVCALTVSYIFLALVLLLLLLLLSCVAHDAPPTPHEIIIMASFFSAYGRGAFLLRDVLTNGGPVRPYSMYDSRCICFHGADAMSYQYHTSIMPSPWHRRAFIPGFEIRHILVLVQETWVIHRFHQGSAKSHIFREKSAELVETNRTN